MANEWNMKPCPFCGETQKLEADECVGESQLHAGCENCGAVGPSVKRETVSAGFPKFITDAERLAAAAKWNERI